MIGTGFAATIVTTPGYTLGTLENVNNAKLNQGFTPIIAIDDTQQPTPIVMVFNNVSLTVVGISGVSSGYIIPTGKMFICTGGWGVISSLTGFTATGAVNLQIQDSVVNVLALNIASTDSSGLSAIGKVFWIASNWVGAGIGSTNTGGVTTRGVAGALSVNVVNKNNSTTMFGNITVMGFLMNAV